MVQTGDFRGISNICAGTFEEVLKDSAVTQGLQIARQEAAVAEPIATILQPIVIL